MAAMVTQIADAVVDALEAATLSQTATVERVYIPLYDRAVREGLTIFVLATSQAIGNASRELDQIDVSVKIAIYKTVDPEVIAEVDAMVEFAEQVLDLLRAKKELMDNVSFVSISNDPVYDPAQLDQHHVFVSVLTITYSLIR